MSYNFLVIFYGSQLKFYTKPRTFYSPGLHFFMIKEAVAIATAPCYLLDRSGGLRSAFPVDRHEDEGHGHEGKFHAGGDEEFR